MAKTVFVKLERGSSLAAFAEERGVTLSALLRANPGLDPRALTEGCALAMPEVCEYTVSCGETVMDVLRRRDMSVTELKLLNPGVDVFSIEAGDVLRVFGVCGEGMRVMGEGETLASLAGELGCSRIDILRANPELRPDEFRCGQCIFLP